MILKKNDKNEEVLECTVDENQYFINFTSDNQNSLRNFFLVVLSKAKDADIEFIYKKEDSFNNVIFEEVAKEYIDGLNAELVSIRNEIKGISLTKEEIGETK